MTKLEKSVIYVTGKAGRALLEKFRFDLPSIRGTGKGIKTFYDLLSDKIIKEFIEKEFPTHSYLTEETGLVDKDSNYLWIVDPLDGTSNFVNHNPFFSVSIALWHKNRPVLGVIEAPLLQERYVAIKGKGAYREDFLRNKKRKVKVSLVSDLGQSYWVFCEGGERDQERIADIFKKVYPQVKEFRKLGSAALELAFVGCGRAEGYLTTKIRFWDIAAGIIFVKEAGGKVSDFSGKLYSNSSFLKQANFDLMATNGRVKFRIGL